MSGIRSFDVQLDLSDLKVMYDYYKAEWLHRPESGWDFSNIGRRASLDAVVEGDAHAYRVSLLDKTWKHKCLLEKRIETEKDEDVKNAAAAAAEEGCELLNHEEEDHDDNTVFGATGHAKASFYLPRRVLPVYQPGDVVKGKVVLDLAEPMEARTLSIELLGRTQIQIRIYHGRGYYDFRKSEDYINESHGLWKTADDAKDVTEAFSLLSTNTQVVSKNLPAGVSHFPFEFVIPSEGKNSVPPLIPSCSHYAHVVYRFKATIDPGMGSRDIIRTRGIWVERPYDISNNLANLKPVQVEEVHKTGLFSSTGQIVIRASIPKKAWVRKDRIPLKIEVDNQNSTEIDSVKAEVLIIGKAKSSDSKMAITKGIKIKGAKCKSDPIPGGTCPQFNWLVPLDFPEACLDSNLIPVEPLNVYQLLDIHYEIFVKATRKGLHRNVEFSIPIVVGTHNSQPN